MLAHYIHRPHVVKRMLNSYFGYVFERYISHLDKLGYKPETIKLYCQGVEHFGQYLENKKVSIDSICKKKITTFIKNHLPKCKCNIPRTTEIKTIRAGIHQLLKIINLDAGKTSKSDKIINDFDEYLSDVCGVSENTRIYRRRYVRAFIKKVKISDILQIEQISPKQIRAFIRMFSCHYKSGSVGVVSTSLRSFLKYLSFQGFNVKKLIPSIPMIPNWKLSAIPQCLSDNQIKKFISSFNRKTPLGKRDYAMACCLTDLGLRCSEVAKLKLKDINWHEAILKISRGKIKQEDQLPLPKKVGKAIADYLFFGRPKTDSEFVFVFHRPPFGKNVRVGTVRNAIRRAFQKAEFNPIPSTHILRHSFASKLLISGASIKEVADMLRHRCIDTTMLYTKIDLPNLHRVSMPWFGRKL